MDVLLNINDLKYKDLFNNMNIYIEKNKITSISGSNKCGKTTLMRIINRDIKDNFNIIIHNKDINSYTDQEYNNMIQVVFPTEYISNGNTIYNELKIRTNEKKDKINYIVNHLKLDNILDKKICEVTEKEIILFQIALAILNNPELILIDELDIYFTIDEIKELFSFFNKCISKYDLTFIITCINLEASIFTDKLYIINDGKVQFKNTPLKVLENDNTLNKIGLEVPFMIDLSVKLKDYDLIKDIKLQQSELINTLWK